MKKANCYVIAGSNGSGKTTFAEEFLPHFAHCKNFVNADLIARGLSPFLPERVSLKAGKLLLSQIHDLAHQHVDFAFESTLSGKTYENFFQQLKKQDYRIHVFFLWIPSAKLASDRIKRRVAGGGHNIPAADVKRRFQRSFANFTSNYAPLADTWYVFDNSSNKPNMIVYSDRDRLFVANKKLYTKIFEGVIGYESKTI